MKPHPINPDHMNEVDLTKTIENKDGTPRLPHERDEAPDPGPIDRTRMKDTGKTPARGRANS
ncbi:MAG TPA: hypothetical protein VIF60_24835 [Burkholderiaceae bacterium]